MTPPLRFLALVVGGWTCARAALLAPWPAAAPEPVAIAAAPPPARTSVVRADPPFPVPPKLRLQPFRSQPQVAPPLPKRARAPLTRTTQPALALAPPAPVKVALHQPPRPHPLTAVPPPILSRPEPLASPSRWSLSAWALARRGGGAALASAGTLGGSQAGARITYRVSAPLAFSARLSGPLPRTAGAEAALGVEWQPTASLPVRILAERRQALGKEGRSAFALLAHGGVSDMPVAAGFRLDAYAQAGAVGLHSRDLFADGAARLTAPVPGKDRIRIGAGAWAAAQPGVSRLDLGPSVTLRLPEAGASLSLDWRLRAAGKAAPASGPALTLAAGF